MRRVILALALGATLLAAYFAPSGEDALVVAPTKSASSPYQKVSVATHPKARAESSAPDLQIRPRKEDPDLGNVFASHTWAPPKTAAAKQEPAPPPQAPPLPYQFLGRWVEGGKTVFFLRAGDRDLAVSVGDRIDNSYTIDEINGGTLVFTYLPLKQKQTLTVGEVN